MRVIFLIIFVYKFITAENSESKYIDLLPDKEKEEFLEKIARRILDEVQAKDDKPKSSGEMSEDQLNQHDAYVRKLLKEEAQNLRKKAGEDSNKHPDPDTTVVGLNKKETNNEDRYVDLTLRTEQANTKKNRRVFTGLSQDSENISNQDRTNYDESDVDIQVKNIRKIKENADVTNKVIETEGMAATVTTTVPILINNDNLSTRENIDYEQKTYVLPDSLNTDKYSDEKKAVKTQNEIETTIHSISDNNLAETAVTTQTSITDSNNQNSSTNSKESVDTGSSNNINSIKNSDIFYDTTTSESAITEEANISHYAGSRVIRSYGENVDIDLHQDSNNSNIDNDTYFNITTQSSQVQDTRTASESTSKVNSDEKLGDSKVINIDITSTKDKPTLATTDMPYVTQNDKDMNTDQSASKINISIEATTTKIEELTAVTLTNSKDIALKENNISRPNEDVKPKLELVPLYLKEPDKKKVEEKTLSTSNIVLINGLVKMLRHDLVNKGEHLDVPQIKTKMKEYKVYEISPDAIPFVKAKSQPSKLDSRHKKSKVQKTAITDINKEQPFYVPIYNYSPDNAFYNPDNVFGPNDDADGGGGGGGGDKDDFKVIKEYVDKDNDFEKDRYQPIENDSDENLNKFDWDYYYQDKHLRKLRFGIKTDANPGQYEPSRVELPPVMKYSKVISTEVNPSDSFDINYYPGRKEENTRSKTTPKQSTNLFDPEFKYSTDAVRRIRQLLFQTKNWSFIQPIKDRTTTTPEPEPEELENENSHLMRARSSKKKTNDVDDKSPVEKYLKRKKKDGPYFFAYKHKHRNIRVPLRFNADSYSKLETQNVNKRPILRKKKGGTDYELMKEILNMVPGGEIMPILQKLQEADIQKLERTQAGSNELDIYVTVLGDMIKENNKALKQYAWLETTVELQSAFKKIIDITEAIQNHDKLHPSDLELLKFLIYLYNLAREEVKIDHIFGAELRNILPKSRIKNRGIIKESGLLNRAWLIRMLDADEAIADDDLRDFNEFLDDLQTALYDLHMAFKYISMVTSFKKQNWLEDLKVLHTDSKRKQLLELILHMTTARLLELIDGSAKNGLDDDYLAYVEKNDEEVVRMQEEFVFIIKLLEELKLAAL